MLAAATPSRKPRADLDKEQRRPARRAEAEPELVARRKRRLRAVMAAIRVRGVSQAVTRRNTPSTGAVAAERIVFGHDPKRTLIGVLAPARINPIPAVRGVTWPTKNTLPCSSRGWRSGTSGEASPDIKPDISANLFRPKARQGNLGKPERSKPKVEAKLSDPLHRA